MRTIYVASALENAKACQELALRLSHDGHKIVSAWHAGNDVDLRTSDEKLTDVEREKIATDAHQNQNLVRANTLIVLYDTRCRSTLYEVGVSFALGQRVVIVGEKSKVPTMLAQRGIIFVTKTTEVEKYL